MLPSKILSEVDTSDVAVFILPGVNRWENEPVESELEQLLKQLDAGNIPNCDTLLRGGGNV